MSLTPFRVPIVPELRKSTILSLIAKGLRIEERDLYTPRLIKIEAGVVERAEGSAQVQLGKTQVLVGVKVDVGTPFKDTPDEGVIAVNAEFVPIASPMFEPGPPDENAIELARVIDRSLRESNAVDRKSLVIIPGQKVWVVHVDIYVLNYDGNLFDASMLATMAALIDTRLPDYEELETGEIRLKEEKKTPLQINKIVTTVNIAKIGDYLIVDPNLDEETVADTKLIVAYDHEGNVVGIQKSGAGSMTREEILKAIDIGSKAARVYFKSLEEALGERLPVKIG
ncbi:MAG: exosome complex protein Rrp42 [Desulfurococcales archaeon]|nr:exosome complex protein Rrp42 [Desulfurococcales archaeon]MCE4628681.1 exosome complex protein Rrp42 [Desulfurococcales archaeon]